MYKEHINANNSSHSSLSSYIRERLFSRSTIDKFPEYLRKGLFSSEDDFEKKGIGKIARNASSIELNQLLYENDSIISSKDNSEQKDSGDHLRPSSNILGYSRIIIQKCPNKACMCKPTVKGSVTCQNDLDKNSEKEDSAIYIRNAENRTSDHIEKHHEKYTSKTNISRRSSSAPYTPTTQSQNTIIEEQMKEHSENTIVEEQMEELLLNEEPKVEEPQLEVASRPIEEKESKIAKSSSSTGKQTCCFCFKKKIKRRTEHTQTCKCCSHKVCQREESFCLCAIDKESTDAKSRTVFLCSTCGKYKNCEKKSCNRNSIIMPHTPGVVLSSDPTNTLRTLIVLEGKQNYRQIDNILHELNDQKNEIKKLTHMCQFIGGKSHIDHQDLHPSDPHHTNNNLHHSNHHHAHKDMHQSDGRHTHNDLHPSDHHHNGHNSDHHHNGRRHTRTNLHHSDQHHGNQYISDGHHPHSGQHHSDQHHTNNDQHHSDQHHPQNDDLPHKDKHSDEHHLHDDEHHPQKDQHHSDLHHPHKDEHHRDLHHPHNDQQHTDRHHSHIDEHHSHKDQHHGDRHHPHKDEHHSDLHHLHNDQHRTDRHHLHIDAHHSHKDQHHRDRHHPHKDQHHSDLHHPHDYLHHSNEHLSDQHQPNNDQHHTDRHHPHIDNHHPHIDEHHPHIDEHHPHIDEHHPHIDEHHPHIDEHHPHIDEHHPHKDQHHSDRHHPHKDQHHSDLHHPNDDLHHSIQHHGNEHISDQHHPNNDQHHTDRHHPHNDQHHSDRHHSHNDEHHPHKDQHHSDRRHPHDDLHHSNQHHGNEHITDQHHPNNDQHHTDLHHPHNDQHHSGRHNSHNDEHHPHKDQHHSDRRHPHDDLHHSNQHFSDQHHPHNDQHHTDRHHPHNDHHSHRDLRHSDLHPTHNDLHQSDQHNTRNIYVCEGCELEFSKSMLKAIKSEAERKAYNLEETDEELGDFYQTLDNYKNLKNILNKRKLTPTNTQKKIQTNNLEEKQDDFMEMTENYRQNIKNKATFTVDADGLPNQIDSNEKVNIKIQTEKSYKEKLSKTKLHTQANDCSFINWWKKSFTNLKQTYKHHVLQKKISYCKDCLSESKTQEGQKCDKYFEKKIKDYRNIDKVENIDADQCECFYVQNTTPQFKKKLKPKKGIVGSCVNLLSVKKKNTCKGAVPMEL